MGQGRLHGSHLGGLRGGMRGSRSSQICGGRGDVRGPLCDAAPDVMAGQAGRLGE